MPKSPPVKTDRAVSHRGHSNSTGCHFPVVFNESVAYLPVLAHTLKTPCADEAVAQLQTSDSPGSEKLIEFFLHVFPLKK
jgi:hypothetical protein